MGLTANSTGHQLNQKDAFEKVIGCDYTIAIAGNPNVGKSTVFNGLTGMHQHTGNWPGKTVANATGICHFQNKNFLLVDIPGTYSIMSHSEEEEIARDYICFGNADATVVIVDATCLERNLNLLYQVMEITPNVVLCVNLLDEARKKGIHIDFKLLEKLLGIPVVGIVARKKKTLKKLMEKVNEVCIHSHIHLTQENAVNDIINSQEEVHNLNNKQSNEIYQVTLNTHQICYPSSIEKQITFLSPTVSQILPKERKNLTRWVCLKLIDGDQKILHSIETNLHIHLLDNEELALKLLLVKSELSSEGLTHSDEIRDKIVSTIIFEAETLCKDVCTYDNQTYNERDRKIDKILTSKKFGIPIMILFLGVIFWITIVGANYPSSLLSDLFAWLQTKLLWVLESLHSPDWLISVLIDGIYTTLTWVIAVMLPPMAIFFPLFTLLEDLGYLPRIAFNLDNFFQKACSSGKQALTMCMGFGCNAAGVVGARIIDSPREKLIAILTNAFVPCNGRFPFLITIATIFIGSTVASGFASSFFSTMIVLLIVLLGVFMSLWISKLLSKTILKGVSSSFMLELPPYRKPQIGKVLIRSIFDRTLFVLGRAITVAVPAGLVIWLFANITIGDVSILTYVASFLNPFAQLMGLDGYILTAFLLGLPANEIVLPIILMSYMQKGMLVDMDNITEIGQILVQNGWTLLTAINVMIFTLLHFPCATTLMTIKKEAGGLKWSVLAFLLPTVCGIVLCMLTTGIWNVVQLII